VKLDLIYKFVCFVFYFFYLNNARYFSWQLAKAFVTDDEILWNSSAK